MECSRRRFKTFLLVVLCLIATLCLTTETILARSPTRSSSSSSKLLLESLLELRGGETTSRQVDNGDETVSKTKWSSFFAVDPSKILSTLVKRGGLLLPKSVERELLALSNVLNVDEASLNVVERQLVVKNFTVNVPDRKQSSLRVGRVHVRWDSYTKPCIDIEVDGVEVLFEFVNLMLTRSNWNELEDAGFPPTMEEYYDPATPSSTFVRIGSIQLSGRVTAEIRSRPLDRVVANVAFDMDSFDGLSREIRKVSEENLSATGRRGCTTDEVYEILRSYFMGKLQKFLKDTAYDLSVGSLDEEGSYTVREARKLLASASDVVKRYAGDAGKKTGDNLQESIARRLEKLGVSSPREKLSALRELTSHAAQSVDARTLAQTQLKRLQETYQNQRDIAVADETIAYNTRSTGEKACAGEETSGQSTVKETIVIFPDW